MTDNYKDALLNRMRQEQADKGKTGLGKKTALDFSLAAGRPINMWKPRYLPDENAFDILPFVITQAWYTKLRMPSGRPTGLPPGSKDYKLQIPVHQNVGNNHDVFLCPREAFGNACPICDEMFELYKTGKAGNKEDEKKAGSLRPSWRTFYNIYDYNEPDKGIQIFEISYYMFESTSKQRPQRINLVDAATLDPSGPVIFFDLQEGKTIVAKFEKRLMGKIDYAEVTDIKFEARDSYGDDILQRVLPLDSMLIIATADEIRNSHFDLEGISEEVSESEHHEQKEAAPATTSTTTTSRSRAGGIQQSVQQPVKQEEKKEEAPTRPSRTPIRTDETKCPAGKAFGKDCNSGPECQGKTANSCDDETFNKCSEAFMKYKEVTSETKEPPWVEEKKEEKPVETQVAAQSSTSRSRRNR